MNPFISDNREKIVDWVYEPRLRFHRYLAADTGLALLAPQVRCHRDLHVC
jgi:hypothetical protein